MEANNTYSSYAYFPHYYHGQEHPLDFDMNSSYDRRFLVYSPVDGNPGDHDYIYDSTGDEGQTNPQKFNSDNLIKLVLISIIFFTALVGNATLTFVVNMVKKKTLRQKMLISVLAITCIIRASVDFMRDIYVVTYHNKWQFNLVICKADAFLDKFSTAVFPYVLLFLVYDSARYVFLISGPRRISPKSLTSYTQKSSFVNLVILICTFLSVITLPLVFSIVLTIMTTTEVISSYGDGIKVTNSTTCQLNVDMFHDFSPFKTYILFHAPIWLLFIPVAVIGVMYVVLAVQACWTRCSCCFRSNNDIVEAAAALAANSCSETNHQSLFEERKAINRNWFITVICLVAIYVVCYVPYVLTKLLYNYLDLPNSKPAIMIIFFLFYAPPALIPLLFATVDRVTRNGYLQHLFCLKHLKWKHLRGGGGQHNNSNNNTNNDTDYNGGSHSVISGSTVYSNKWDGGGAAATTPTSRTTCTTISICSDLDLYGNQEQDDEHTHIIPSSPDMSTCSRDEWSSTGSHSNGRRGGGRSKPHKVRGGEAGDNEDSDATPILVTSL